MPFLSARVGDVERKANVYRFGIEKVPADRGLQLGDCGQLVPQATNWQDATRAFIVVTTRQEALRCFGEAMVGGGGRALRVARLRVKPSGHS